MRFLSLIFFLLLFSPVFSHDSCNDTIEYEYLGAQAKDKNTLYQTVYVCTGNYAYTYHSRNDCRGLNNCQADVQYTDEQYAIISDRLKFVLRYNYAQSVHHLQAGFIFKYQKKYFWNK